MLLGRLHIKLLCLSKARKDHILMNNTPDILASDSQNRFDGNSTIRPPLVFSEGANDLPPILSLSDHLLSFRVSELAATGGGS